MRAQLMLCEIPEEDGGKIRNRVLITEPIAGRRILLSNRDGWPKNNCARWRPEDLTDALELTPNGIAKLVEEVTLPDSMVAVITAYADINQIRGEAEEWLTAFIKPYVDAEKQKIREDLRNRP